MPRLGIELDRTSVHLEPGETAEVRVSLTNKGKTVDAFNLTVVGLDPSWYVLTQDEVRLFPEDTGEVVLRVKPAAGYTSQAGVYPFTVVAYSHDDPGDRVQSVVVLTLASVGEIAIGITPQRVQGRKGSFWVTLQNPGNSPRQAVLVLTDPEEAINYTLGGGMQVEAAGGQPPSFPPPGKIANPMIHGEGYLEQQLELPPGSDLTFPLVVRPIKRIWTGMEKTFQLEARIHPPGVEWEVSEAKRIQASLVYRPILAGWSGIPRMLRLALTLALPLLILALLLYLLLKPPDGPSAAQVAASQTATAIALSVSADQTAQAASAQQTAQAMAQTMTAVAVANGGNQAAANATLTALALSPEELAASQTATALALAAQADAGAPSIDKFFLIVASPTVEGDPTATSGDSNDDGRPDVGWDVTSAKSIHISQNARQFDSPDPSLSIVDYTMVATGTERVATSTLSILLVRPPQIDWLIADPTVIPAGASSTISFHIRGSGTCSMDGASMPIPPNGDGSVVVTPPETHIYIHCVENAAGRNCRSVKITVLPAGTATPAPAPPTPTATVPPVVVPTVTKAPPPPTSAPKPTSTKKPTSTPKPTSAPKPSATSKPPTSTPLPPATATLVPTRPPSATPPPSATSTGTATATGTATSTRTFTSTSTPTHTSSPTHTATATRTSTATSTRTATRTATPTATATCTPYYVITRDTAPAVGIVEGVDTGNHCDNCTTAITLPFPIYLYDQEFTSALVGSNGTISFTNSNALPDNECLPTSDLEFAIFPYWDDLDTRVTRGFPNAGIFTQLVYNSAGNTFSIQWNALVKASVKPVSFVLHFYEDSTRFDIVYLTDDGSGGAGATIGVEEAYDPDSGVGSYSEYSCNQGRSVAVRTRLRFAYTACESSSGTPGIP